MRMKLRAARVTTAALSTSSRRTNASEPVTDPVKVAAAMEGMHFKSFNGDVELRKADHQMQQGLYIAKWEKASAKYPVRCPENTGHDTFVPVKYYERLCGEHAHHLPDEAAKPLTS